MKLAIATLSFFLLFGTQAYAENSLGKALTKAAPELNPEVLTLALQAMKCAEANGVSPSDRLAVIDYSLPSTERRLWIFDILKPRLLFRELVAHGKTTGENFAEFFSNEPGSLATSLGLFKTLDTYQGSNGYSLRMSGLEPGFNDRAYDRAIVIHGAPYVDPKAMGPQGRLGRSYGCPAVRTGVARKIIDTLKGGQFVFSYFPDRKWLTASHLLNCRQAVASIGR